MITMSQIESFKRECQDRVKSYEKDLKLRQATKLFINEGIRV